MNIKHYTYRVTWSPEDGEHVGLCAEFPSLSWLAKTPEAALKGIRLVMTTASRYTPTKNEFDTTMQTHGKNIRVFAGQPSSGVSAILRSSCITSTRMQGQPTC